MAGAAVVRDVAGGTATEVGNPPHGMGGGGLGAAPEVVDEEAFQETCSDAVPAALGGEDDTCRDARALGSGSSLCGGT